MIVRRSGFLPFIAAMSVLALGQSASTDQQMAITEAVKRFPNLWRNVSMEVYEGTESVPPGTPSLRKATTDASGSVFESSYSLVAQNLDVRIDRHGEGLADGKLGGLRRTQWYVDGKRYVSSGVLNPVHGDTDQGAFAKNRGTLPTPLQFSYQRYGCWLADYLDNFKWNSLKYIDSSAFGKVISVDRDGQFGPETLELWPGGGYMIVGVTFHGKGRSYQYNTLEAQQVQGIWFPKRMAELHFASEDTSQEPESKMLYEVEHLQFDRDLRPDLFDPKWAENSVIKDGDATTYYRVHDGKLVFDPSLNPKNDPIKAVLFVGSFAMLVGFIGYSISRHRRTRK